MVKGFATNMDGVKGMIIANFIIHALLMKFIINKVIFLVKLILIVPEADGAIQKEIVKEKMDAQLKCSVI